MPAPGPMSIGACTGACMGVYIHILLLGQIRSLQVAPVGSLDEFYLAAHALSWSEADSVKGSV